VQLQLHRLPSVQDGLDDVQCEQRQPQEAAEVTALDTLRRRHLADRA
jgi:hypothetical protein